MSNHKNGKYPIFNAFFCTKHFNSSPSVRRTGVANPIPYEVQLSPVLKCLEGLYQSKKWRELVKTFK